MDKLLHNICESMSDDTIEAIAKHITSKTDFGVVETISNNMWRLAETLGEYAEWEAPFNVLIVDSVLTTAASMEAAKAAQPPQVHPDDVIGYVIFACGELPDWVDAVFSIQ